MSRLSVELSALVHALRDRLRDQRGQSTVEYALVVLGAATIAVMLLAWASGTGAISSLLDRVMNAVTSKVG
jgi:Flp pilus assembly pilin Flp